MDIKDLTLNTQIAEDGEWITDLPGMGDLRLKVRGMNAKAVTSLQNSLLRKLPRNERERDGRPTPDAALRVMKETLVDAVLLDWDGLTMDGKPLKYDKARAKAMILDERFRLFADAVFMAAQIVDNTREADAEDAAKN